MEEKDSRLYDVEPAVIQVNNVLVPTVCVSCGAECGDIHLLGFKTAAWNATRQLIAYCSVCMERIGMDLIRLARPAERAG